MYNARVIIYRDGQEIYNIRTLAKKHRFDTESDIKGIASSFESGDLGWEIGEEPEDDEDELVMQP